MAGLIRKKTGTQAWETVEDTGGGGSMPADVQEYTTPGSFVWTKPDGVSLVRIVAISAAGGGSGGEAKIALDPDTGLNGGSGGAAGSRVELVVPASALEATMDVVVGAGGAGGAGGTDDGGGPVAPGDGGNGGDSYVTSDGDIVIHAHGGGAGQFAFGGLTQSPWISWVAIPVNFAGNGGKGGTPEAPSGGASNTAFPSGSGGAGGAGVDSATQSAWDGSNPDTDGVGAQPQGGIAPGGNGSDGPYNPFWRVGAGASSGASNVDGDGGNGGNGNVAGGGAGGGAGAKTSGTVAGGDGGDGGDGYIRIEAW